jgi:hypothetical protein
LASGKRVVYYYAYDENNVRLPGRSTGATTMMTTRTVCSRFLKDGLLVPGKKAMPTFGEYAQNWWEWDTFEYLKKGASGKTLPQDKRIEIFHNLRNTLNSTKQ